MIDGKFDVVFRGQIVKSFDISDVKSNLVKLFKSSPEAIERLFCGEEVAIRKDLDYAQAMKYQSALKSAGALALIKEVENSQQTETNQSDNSQSTQTTNQPKEASTANSVQSQESENSTADGDLTIAAPGTQILPDKVYEKREVDTSELSLAAAGERILPPKAPVTHPQPSIDHLSLDEK